MRYLTAHIYHITAAILICLFSMLLAGTPHGSELARTKNMHSGNKVRTTFYNYGLVGRTFDGVDDIGGEWPINSTHEYIGDVGLMVGSEIKDIDGSTKHSVVTILSPRGSELSGNTHWGWEPLPGYTNTDTTLSAMSHMGPPINDDDINQVNTWPDFWPDKMDDTNDPGWPSSWNGYFGKNQKNAEQESFFIMDDANDAEFLFYPDSTDFERRGLGLNATVRGLQWNHILAEDVLFWLYDIKNIGHKIHNKMIFGYIVGTITGGDGDSQDDYADFDKVDDIAFSYDHGTDLETGLGGIGAGGWSPVGLAGYAFLESPGNSVDGIDNDGDGYEGEGEIIIEAMFDPVSYAPGEDVIKINYHDYSREIIQMPSDSLIIEQNGTLLIFYPNTSMEEIPRNLIDDNLNGLIDENNGASIELSTGFFENVYLNVGLKYINYFTDLGTENLMIDESRSDGIDNDGDWDRETDDVGRDGAPGSGDSFYGEGDSEPTSGFELIDGIWVDSGLPGEPNIDKTDIDESDQIGLSSFYYFTYGVGPDMSNDTRLWDEMNPGYFNKSVQNADADFLFGSGYFPLLPGETERFSVGLLFGDNLPDLIRNKQTVQTIYNQNYNFAKAPELPSLRAYAGDGYVTLYWDDRAEESFDRISGYDFEGYKIYKATDTQFTDAGMVTDAFGSPKFNVPVKQYDLDNEYSDFFPGDVDGIKFFLGNNTGLVHAWTDSNVINGHRYFYAVTSYDHGHEEKEILPAESSKFVTIDKGGNVQTAINVISVIPDAPAAGFIPPEPEEDVKPVGKVRGTGSITLNNLDPSKIPSGRVYRIYFKDSHLNGLDDDFDWIPYWDTPNGIWDTTEVFFDVGLDGISDSLETGFYYLPDGSQVFGGYHPVLNPDPAHDNYDIEKNCSDHADNDGDGEVDETDSTGCADYGTEGNNAIDFADVNEDGFYQSSENGEPFIDFGNGVQDPGEELKDDIGSDGVGPGDPGYYGPDADSTEGNGIPDLGEPNFDFYDVDEALPVTSHYMIVDVTSFNKSDTVITWTQDLDGDKSMFDGMQIVVDNDWTIRKAALGFVPEYETEYSIDVAPFEFYGYATEGISYPRDIQFIFSDELIGHSSSIDLLQNNGSTYNLPEKEMNFIIQDPFDGSPIDFAVIDQSIRYIVRDSANNIILDSIYVESGHFSKFDRIILLENLSDTTVVSWSITPTGEDSSAILHKPGNGDTLNIIFKKPFTSNDVFEFVSNAPYIDKSKVQSEIDLIKVVPNPYIGGASWEGQNPYSSGRGPRSIHFNHLPPMCEIRIYTLAGELVDKFQHNTVIEDGTAEWDMMTKDNLDISYGIYIYHIEPIADSDYDFEPVLGKFAVIK